MRQNLTLKWYKKIGRQKKYVVSRALNYWAKIMREKKSQKGHRIFGIHRFC